MATTLNLRLDEAAPAGITLPSGPLAAWSSSNNNAFGANAKMLDDQAAGSVQASTNYTTNASGSAASNGIGQFCSRALSAQTISAGNWTIAFAAAPSLTTSWNGFIALYLVNGATGAIRSTIFALGTPTGSSTGRVGTSELTVFSTTTSGSSVTAQAGDYLVLEAGIQNTNGAGSHPVCTLYSSGTTAISSDAAATASAFSLITAPVTLTFQPQQMDEEEGWLARGRQLAVADVEQIPWLAWPFIDIEEPVIKLTGFGLDEEQLFQPAASIRPAAQIVVASGDDEGVQLAAVAAEEDAAVAYTFTRLPGRPITVADGDTDFDDHGVNLTNFYLDDDAAAAAGRIAVSSSATPATGDDDPGSFVKLGLDDESNPPASRQAAPANTVFPIVEHDDIMLTRFGLDDEPGPAVKMPITVSVPANAPDEDGIGRVAAFAPDDDAPAVPIVISVSRNFTMAGDEDPGTGLALFTLDEDPAFVAQVQQQISRPITAGDGDTDFDDHAVQLANFYLDDDPAFVPQIELYPSFVYVPPQEEAVYAAFGAYTVDEEAGEIRGPGLGARGQASIISADEDAWPALKNFALEEEASPLSRTTYVTYQSSVAGDEDARPQPFIGIEDDPAASLARLTVTWAGSLVTDEDAGVRLVYPGLDEDPGFVPLLETILQSPAVSTDTEDPGAQLKLFGLDDDPAFTPQRLLVTQSPAVSTDAEDPGIQFALPRDDDPAFVPQVLKITWNPAVSADEDPGVRLVYPGLDDDPAFVAQRLVTTWNPAVSLDEDMGAGLAAFGRDDDPPFVASVTVTWKPAPAVLDEDMGAQLRLFGLDDEPPPLFWDRPRILVAAGNAPAATDEDPGAQLLKFGLDEDPAFVPQVETIAWLPRPSLDEDPATHLAALGLDEDPGFVPQSMVLTWNPWLMTEEEAAVQLVRLTKGPTKVFVGYVYLGGAMAGWTVTGTIMR